MVYYVGCRKTNTDRWSVNCRTLIRASIIRYDWCYSYSHPPIAGRQDCTSLYFRGMPTNDILATVPTHRWSLNYLIEFRSMESIKTISMKFGWKLHTWCDGPLGASAHIVFCTVAWSVRGSFDSIRHLRTSVSVCYYQQYGIVRWFHFTPRDFTIFRPSKIIHNYLLQAPNELERARSAN